MSLLKIAAGSRSRGINRESKSNSDSDEHSEEHEDASYFTYKFILTHF